MVSLVDKKATAKRLKLWFIQMRTSVYTRGGQGLSQAHPALLEVEVEETVGTLAFMQFIEHLE